MRDAGHAAPPARRFYHFTDASGRDVVVDDLALVPPDARGHMSEVRLNQPFIAVPRALPDASVPKVPAPTNTEPAATAQQAPMERSPSAGTGLLDVPSALVGLAAAAFLVGVGRFTQGLAPKQAVRLVVLLVAGGAFVLAFVAFLQWQLDQASATQEALMRQHDAIKKLAPGGVTPGAGEP